VPRSHRRSMIAVAGAALLWAAATGCSGSSESDTTEPTASAVSGGSNKVIAPVMVDAATANGQVVKARVGETVVIDADEPTKWTGTVADPSVATFFAGQEAGGATFNPGLTDLHVGTTAVTITNGSTTVTFTLEVAAAG